MIESRKDNFKQIYVWWIGTGIVPEEKNKCYQQTKFLDILQLSKVN